MKYINRLEYAKKMTRICAGANLTRWYMVVECYEHLLQCIKTHRIINGKKPKCKWG